MGQGAVVAPALSRHDSSRSLYPVGGLCGVLCSLRHQAFAFGFLPRTDSTYCRKTRLMRYDKDLSSSAAICFNAALTSGSNRIEIGSNFLFPGMRRM